MSAAAYEPWSRVENIDVPVTGDTDITHVRVPFVYAASAPGVLKTATIVAWLLMKAIATANAIQAIEARHDTLYEPPLVRFRCSGCTNDWDAWVDETGHLEDPYDSVCTHSGCPRMGQPAQLLTD